MPLPIVSPTLFNAHALPADPADTHLQPGIHLRVDAHPLLGLPVAPYIVWRAVLRDARQIKLRDDVVFVDSRGRVLTAPFTLTPGQPGDGTPRAGAGADLRVGARQRRPGRRRRSPGQPAPTDRSARRCAAWRHGSTVRAVAASANVTHRGRCGQPERHRRHRLRHHAAGPGRGRPRAPRRPLPSARRASCRSCCRAAARWSAWSGSSSATSAGSTGHRSRCSTCRTRAGRAICRSPTRSCVPRPACSRRRRSAARCRRRWACCRRRSRRARRRCGRRSASTRWPCRCSPTSTG